MYQLIEEGKYFGNDTQDQIQMCLNCTKETCTNCLRGHSGRRSGRFSKRRIDLLGQRFGSWVVVAPAPPQPGTSTGAFWYCKCDCGTESIVSSKSLRAGDTLGCVNCRYERMMEGDN